MKNRNLKHVDEWATPKSFYDELNKRFNFTFDPCPLNYDAITPETDGLLKDWGASNFVNPPYSRKLKEAFIRKAYEESKKGKKVVMLLPVSTSTKIFHEVIFPNCDIEFVKGRIGFIGYRTDGSLTNEKTKGMHDSMLCIFR